jgi:hypothetical protein
LPARSCVDSSANGAAAAEKANVDADSKEPVNEERRRIFADDKLPSAAPPHTFRGRKKGQLSSGSSGQKR